jgi:hypothetical protein
VLSVNADLHPPAATMGELNGDRAEAPPIGAGPLYELILRGVEAFEKCSNYLSKIADHIEIMAKPGTNNSTCHCQQPSTKPSFASVLQSQRREQNEPTVTTTKTTATQERTAAFDEKFSIVVGGLKSDADLLQTLRLYAGKEVEVTRCVRLGKFAENKPPPLTLVFLKSQDDVNILLANRNRRFYYSQIEETFIRRDRMQPPDSETFSFQPARRQHDIDSCSSFSSTPRRTKNNDQPADDESTAVTTSAASVDQDITARKAQPNFDSTYVSEVGDDEQDQANDQEHEKHADKNAPEQQTFRRIPDNELPIWMTRCTKPK